MITNTNLISVKPNVSQPVKLPLRHTELFLHLLSEIARTYTLFLLCLISIVLSLYGMTPDVVVMSPVDCTSSQVVKITHAYCPS